MSGVLEHPFDLLNELDRRSQARAAEPVPEQAAGMVGRLALRFGEHRIMVSMEDISQIIPLPSITPVPGVKAWLMGIANLRGTVLSVVNLGEFLVGKASTVSKTSRIVTVNSGDWHYGLLIDEVIGMRHFADHSQTDLANVPAPLSPYVDTVYDSEDHHWMVFNVTTLVGNAYFLDAAA